MQVFYALFYLLGLFLFNGPFVAASPLGPGLQKHTLRFRLKEIPVDWVNMARGGMGASGSMEGWSQKDGFSTYLQPYLEYGAESALIMDGKFYLGAALSWTISYPRNWTSALARESPYSLWYIPITDIRLGYVFSNQITLALGMVYVWASSIIARFPITADWFFETKAILWIDRLFDKNGFYNEKGFDNFHQSFSILYHF